MRIRIKALYATLAPLALAISALSAPIVHAESQPIPMPGDTRLVQFIYNPNETYTVLTRPMSTTHIELASDEELHLVALGNTVEWILAKQSKHLFIKPIRPDIFTSATIITTKRTYQLTFRSSPENGKWMQRVSWLHPDLDMLQKLTVEEKVKSAAETLRATQDEAVTLGSGVTPDKLGFGYEFQGDETLRPDNVFDDGRFMYVRLKPNTQSIPAFFGVDADGSMQVLNYTVKGELIIVQRLLPRLLMKLGKAELLVLKAGAKPASGRGFLGLFSSTK
jgi:type IV secretion system protein TrbG